ncbi:MAG: c-type cytochrome [Hyphomicrobiaceae bacterium]
MHRNALIGLAIAVAAGLALSFWPRTTSQPQSGGEVKLPVNFTSAAQNGRKLFDANCSVCHGANASGTGNGPPLVHLIYEPGHHSDASFYRAAEFGVQGHHWPFGNMPAIKTVTRDDVTNIISYVRELQRANGIN